MYEARAGTALAVTLPQVPPAREGGVRSVSGCGRRRGCARVWEGVQRLLSQKHMLRCGGKGRGMSAEPCSQLPNSP